MAIGRSKDSILYLKNYLTNLVEIWFHVLKFKKKIKVNLLSHTQVIYYIFTSLLIEEKIQYKIAAVKN